MSNKKIAIQFNNVGKQYRLGRVGTGTLSHDLNRFWQTQILRREDPYLKIGESNDRSKKGESDYVWALKDISFKVEQGDVVGIIGKNGAGKSTLLKLLSRITSPTIGSIKYNGRIASLLEVGTGFHPELTGRENIYMNGSIMGMTKTEITRKLDEIVDFAGVERYLDTPVKRYSSGMTVRLGFAVAAFLEPEILVVDEVLTVGDAEFQKKAIGKMKDVSQGGGRTVLFVSHNMAAVRSLCNTGVVLKNGLMELVGTAEDCVEHYLASANDTDHELITSHIKTCAPTIKINKILLNGTECDSTVIGKNQQTIPIWIEGYTTEEFKGSLQFKLRNIAGAALATYSEGAYMDYMETFQKGAFVIEREIQLPKNLGSGMCIAEIEINRHSMGQVYYYMYAPECSYIQFEGYTENNGHPLKILEEGLFGLQSNITTKDMAFCDNHKTASIC